MKHAEYKRIVPGTDTAVLLVHGILGSPNHFRELIPLEQLVPGDWSVYNVLLDWHGAKSSMKNWRNQVKESFLELSRNHDRVIIVAHSMGTLFAIQLAAEFPEKIPFLFLLGVPLRPHMRPGMMCDCLRMALNKLPRESVLWKATSISTTKKLWKYIRWIPRYLELFREIGITERMLGQLHTPCTAYQSRKDELVNNLSARVLKSSGKMIVHELKDSTHFSYTPADEKRIWDDFVLQMKGKTHD